MPTSLPWRMPWVGSWPSQNVCRMRSSETFAGSQTTSTASVWPGRAASRPPRTSGSACSRPRSRRRSCRRPASCQNRRSAPQKQPMPTTSCWKPSGNGPLSGVPSTSWLAGTGISVSRPGSARSGSIIFIFSRNRNTRDSSLKSVLPRVVRRTSPALHGREEAEQRVDRGRVELRARWCAKAAAAAPANARASASVCPSPALSSSSPASTSARSGQRNRDRAGERLRGAGEHAQRAGRDARAPGRPRGRPPPRRPTRRARGCPGWSRGGEGQAKVSEGRIDRPGSSAPRAEPLHCVPPGEVAEWLKALAC